MKIDISTINALFTDSSLSGFFAETDLFYIDFQSGTARSCYTLRSLGYEDNDLLNITSPFSVQEADKERADRLIHRLIANEADSVIDAFRVASKDGSSYHWLRFSTRVVSRDAEGRPEAIIGHVLDVDDLITSQEEIRDRLVEIDAMRELITAINKSLDFEETFLRIIEQLHRIIPFDRASAQSLENDRLTVVAGFGYREGELEGLTFPAHGIENPSVRALQEHKIVICNNVPEEFPGFIRPNNDFITLSWLGIPLIYEKKVIGLLALDNQALNAYNDQHVRIVSSLADYIAIALEHARKHQLVTYQAMTDRLSGLANRYGLETQGMEIFQKSIEQDQPIGVLMIDIDHFKQVNDTYGHAYGDIVLRSITQAIREQIRSRDYAVRYGGEEFVVLLPGLSAREALIVAERLRIRISQTVIEKERKLPTVSIGIYAAVPGPLDILHEFIRRADLALYTAKEAGRNRSRVWSTSPEFYVNE
ncbi:MAG: diguanylate cyclase [Rectinema sp.]